MFSLTVSDHVMIAHSFHGEEFGPAQRIHGATYVIEAEFRAHKLDRRQLLVDIGLAKIELRRVLDQLDYTNLDENAVFRGINTTTEYVAYHIHGQLVATCHEGKLGEGGRAVSGIKITVRESPNAWAAYESDLA